MEAMSFVLQLGQALWDLKGAYDQHIGNKNEIKELQDFIQQYEQYIPALKERFKASGGNNMGVVVFKHLEIDIVEATRKLKEWSTNRGFFRVLNSVERMHELENLHTKVMASVQKALGIASLSMLLDIQTSQATMLQSTVELKSILTTSISSMSGMLPPEVRAEVVEASQTSHADEKFWEEVLAAVDNHDAGSSSLSDSKKLYMDPILNEVMIDPIVASNGHTYCRWTIIDHNMTKDPHNVNHDLAIMVDNVIVRTGLFEEFPEKLKEFRQRRSEYRCKALSLARQELLGDAQVALQYVLQWDKNDEECTATLVQVQKALKKARAQYAQYPLPLMLTDNKVDKVELPCNSDGMTMMYKWNFKLARASVTLQGHQGSVIECVAWSPDGGQLATANTKSKKAIVWDAKSGKKLATMKDHSNVVTSLAWNPNGDQLATMTNKAITVWSAKSGKVKWKLTSNSWLHRWYYESPNGYYAMAWSVDGGKLAVGCNGGIVALHDAKSGKMTNDLCVSEYGIHSSLNTVSVSWSPNGALLTAVTAGSGGSIWRVGLELDKLFALKQSSLRVECPLAWNPDGDRLATACFDETNYEHQLHEEKHEHMPPIKTRIIAAVWDVTSKKILITLKGRFTKVAAITWSPDGYQLATVSTNGSATVWEVESGLVMFCIEATRKCLAWNPKGGLLVTASFGNAAIIWDSKLGEKLFILEAHKRPIHSLAWSPDGDELATGSKDGTLKVWVTSKAEAKQSMSEYLLRSVLPTSIVTFLSKHGKEPIPSESNVGYLAPTSFSSDRSTVV